MVSRVKGSNDMNNKCPHCGREIESNKSNNLFLVIIFGITSGTLIIGLFIYQNLMHLIKFIGV